MVDFVDYRCEPGTLIHVHPGQVQRLPVTAGGRPADLDAIVLLFMPVFPPRLAHLITVVDDRFSPHAGRWLPTSTPPCPGHGGTQRRIRRSDQGDPDLTVELQRVFVGLTRHSAARAES